jgi:antitoxin PrlF
MNFLTSSRKRSCSAAESCSKSFRKRWKVAEWEHLKGNLGQKDGREAEGMARTTLRAKGQLTLPDDIRKAAKLEEGDLIEAEVSERGEVILRPLATIDRSQAWFWTAEWQAGEREATEQARGGEGEVFRTDDDFLDSLG